MVNYGKLKLGWKGRIDLPQTNRKITKTEKLFVNL